MLSVLQVHCAFTYHLDTTKCVGAARCFVHYRRGEITLEGGDDKPFWRHDHSLELMMVRWMMKQFQPNCQ
jgi:hypothetical protein